MSCLILNLLARFKLLYNVDRQVSLCVRRLKHFRCAMRLCNCHALIVAVFCAVVDLPRVTGLPPRVFLTRGLSGRIDCPVEANPPVTIIVWAKNGVMVGDDDGPATIGGGGGSRGRRLRTSPHGTLFIRSVEKTDEGRYVCTPYSPIGKGQASMPVQVFVRGTSNTTCRCHLCLVWPKVPTGPAWPGPAGCNVIHH